MENLAPILVASSLETVRKTYGLPPLSAAVTLGEGTFGVVKSVGHLALKKFRANDGDGLDPSSIREIGVYQYLTKHAPHIAPKAVSVIIDDVHSNGAILMDKYPYTLHTSPIGITEDKFVSIARSLIEKLCTWSKLGISHRDIKPQNIVFNPDSSDLRVIDWGAASFNHWSSPEYGLTTEVCTLWYRCPEILLGAKHYNPTALDIWSVAASLIHLWSRIKSGTYNLAGDSEIDTLIRIFELVGSPTSEAMKKLPIWSDKLPNFPTRKVSKTWKLPDDQLSDLVDKMLVTDPCDRVTIDGIMRHPFMATSSSAAVIIPILPCRTRSNIMSHQTDINGKMRQILIDWLIEVSVKFKLKMETLLLAVEIIDDMLLRKLYIRQKLQLLGVTAMLVAGKLLEIYSPEVRDYVYITDTAYTREQILDCEKTILMTIPDLYTIMAQGPAHIAAKTVTNTNASMWISVLLSIYDGTYSTDNAVGTIVSVYNAADGGGPIAPALSALFPKNTKSSLVSAHKILGKLMETSAVIGAIDAIFFETPAAPVVAPTPAPVSVVPDKPPLHPPAPVSVVPDKPPLHPPAPPAPPAPAPAPAPASAVPQKIRIIIRKKDTPVPPSASDLLILAP